MSSFFQMTHDLSTEIEALDGDVLPHESCHDYSKGVFQIRTNFTPEIVCDHVCPTQHVDQGSN